ncbi:MAG TPA: hypothetical protein VMZ73_10410 [Acidimicrobiales bacterium]|nr:hypothetical protein [Acidimicrobiales bacterium]
MRMHVVHAADTGDLAALRNAARDGRAAAMSRRRALAAGKSALVPAHERARTGFRECELRAPAAAVDPSPPAASSGQSGPSGGQGAPGGPAVAADGVAAARLGRALSMQRRRQMSQGKQALNGGGDRTAAAACGGTRAFIVYRGGAR